jgi:copper chaperone CopZ
MKQLIFLTLAAIATLSTCSKTASDKQAETAAEAPATETNDALTHAHIAVDGNCGVCKERIESAAKAVAGVASAEWDGDEKQLHLDFDAAETSPEAISKAVAQAGFDTQYDNAPGDVYNALPECCKYR